MRVRTDGRALEIPAGEALEGVRGEPAVWGRGWPLGAQDPFPS